MLPKVARAQNKVYLTPLCFHLGVREALVEARQHLDGVLGPVEISDHQEDPALRRGNLHNTRIRAPHVGGSDLQDRRTEAPACCSHSLHTHRTHEKKQRLKARACMPACLPHACHEEMFQHTLTRQGPADRRACTHLPLPSRQPKMHPRLLYVPFAVFRLMVEWPRRSARTS